MFVYILISFLLVFFITFNQNNGFNIFIQLSAASLSYLSYLPIAAKAWKLIGYKTVIIIVCHTISKEILFIENILFNSSSEVLIAKFDSNISLHYSSKLSRIFGFIISKIAKEKDYFYLADADMIPLSKKYFRDVNYKKLTIKSYDINGYGYGNSRGRWAMCYMVANKFIWKEILSSDITDYNITNLTVNLMNKLMKKGMKYFEKFYFMDEVYLRDKIKEWKGYRNSVLFHIRDFKTTRINRNAWPKNFSKIDKNIIDIHLPILPIKFDELINIWGKKIIPLQDFLFNDVPYGMEYIKRIYSLNIT